MVFPKKTCRFGVFELDRELPLAAMEIGSNIYPIREDIAPSIDSQDYSLSNYYPTARDNHHVEYCPAHICRLPDNRNSTLHPCKQK